VAFGKGEDGQCRVPELPAGRRYGVPQPEIHASHEGAAQPAADPHAAFRPMSEEEQVAEAIRRSLADGGGPAPDPVPEIPLDDLAQWCNGFNPLSEELGRGAFGTVYKGTKPDGTAIAVKMLQHREALESFRREAAIMRMCRHGCVVPLLAISTGFRFCLVMPRMDKSLETVLQDEACTPAQRVRYACNIFAGSAYLHRATAGKPTIVHRDIKPENVLLKDGAARLGDVGIAREMASTYARTTVQGTFEFLDPEYESSQRLTTASDVYSAGIVVFQLLAGADTDTLTVAYSLTAGLTPAERWPRRWEAQQRTCRPTAVAQGAWPGELAEGLHALGAQCTARAVGDRPSSATARDIVVGLQRGPEPPEPRECIVCLSAPRGGMLRPCRHNIVCEPCAQILIAQQQHCPLCRRGVDNFFPGTYAQTFVPPGPRSRGG
jgi:hypothetical protein